MKWGAVVAFSCAATVCTTAYAKFETEIYPSIIFPSFGQVLDVNDIPPGVGTSIVLHHGADEITVGPGDWFDGPPSSALDRLSAKLAELPGENRDWMFERADDLAGGCVERIEILVAPSDEPLKNQFERSCA